MIRFFPRIRVSAKIWKVKMRITTFLAVLSALMLGPMGQSAAMGEMAKVAPWYRNYDGAMSLRFDDNRESHIKIVVPALNQYGFKATFMVNPGKDSYIKNRDFWEGEVVEKGHRLGNHTMHHNGAKTLEEAEYEIGEAAKILRSAQNDESGLLVFAAGGLTRWGGKRWEESSEPYKHLVEKFHLIDLYDGFHASKPVQSTDSSKGLCVLAQEAIETGAHRALFFHDIGKPGIKDLLKQLLKGRHLTFGKENFMEFLTCLDGKKEKLWIAPLSHIYKYEAERNSASLTLIENGRNLVRLKLKVGTDPNLYDQKLTLMVPAPGRKVLRILQEGEPVQEYERINDMVLVQVKPKTTVIAIYQE